MKEEERVRKKTQLLFHDDPLTQGHLLDDDSRRGEVAGGSVRDGVTRTWTHFQLDVVIADKDGDISNLTTHSC